MFKNMLKGIVNTVLNEVKTEVANTEFGKQLKNVSKEIDDQFTPQKAEPKKETTASGELKKSPEQEAILGPADAEFALELPEEDGERKTFSVIAEQTYSYLVPQDPHFCDRGNSGAFEIHQAYSYEDTDDADRVADIYFSIAAELDCDIKESSARASYARYHGAAVYSKLMTLEHPVFTHVYVFESSRTYRLTYLKRIEENELLGCELILKKTAAGEALKASVIKEFKKLAGSCRME